MACILNVTFSRWLQMLVAQWSEQVHFAQHCPAQLQTIGQLLTEQRRRKFIASIQPAKAYEDKSVMILIDLHGAGQRSSKSIRNAAEDECLFDNGQHKSTRLLVLVPHERPHGTMRMLEKHCRLLPEVHKMRAIKDRFGPAWFLFAAAVPSGPCRPS